MRVRTENVPQDVASWEKTFRQSLKRRQVHLLEDQLLM